MYVDETFENSFPQWELIETKQYARTFKHTSFDRYAEVYAKDHTVLITDERKTFCHPVPYETFKNYPKG